MYLSACFSCSKAPNPTTSSFNWSCDAQSTAKNLNLSSVKTKSTSAIKKNTLKRLKKLNKSEPFIDYAYAFVMGKGSVLISSPTRTCSLPIKVDPLILHQRLWAYLLMKIPHNLQAQFTI